jgi:hypothetical protein
MYVSILPMRPDRWVSWRMLLPGIANIQLLNPKDSSFLCGGVSNANGDFVIPCQQKQALMKVSFVGYKTICKLVPIARIGNVKMQANSYLLKGVTVEAARVVEKVDRQIIFPTKEQVDSSSRRWFVRKV